MERPNPIEESIVRKFARPIWHRFLKGVKEYDLIQEGDRIAVCISGGKDSMLLANCMRRLRRYSKFPFEVIFLTMDPGYSEHDHQKLLDNAARMEIPLHVFENRIPDAAADSDQNPGSLCARMQQGHLYKKAQELGCNKIALGHHLDDVIETILMGLLCGSQVRTMMPKIHSECFPGMQLIRPLYLVREKDILAWKDYNALEFIQCGCRMTEHIDSIGESKRQEVKALLAELRKQSPQVDTNIFRSVENVNLKTIISYHIGDEYHHFLDDYDKGITNHGTVSGEGRHDK